MCVCVCTGSTDELAEGQLQSSFLSVDPPQGTACIHRVCTQVGAQNGLGSALDGVLCTHMYSYPHRYSLPVNFQAVVMKPNKKAQKRLTDTLNQLYGHLDSRYIESEAEVSTGQGGCSLWSPACP